MIDQREVQQRLALYENRLANCARQAMGQWTAIPAKQRAALTPNRTFANVLWAFFRDFAFVEFGDDPGVVLSEKHGTLSLIFDDALMLRFKHLDARGKSSNYPTQTSLAFWGQEVLPGIAASLPRLQLCWREDPLRVGLVTLDVVMKHGSSVLWRYPILQHEVSALEPLARELQPRVRGKVRIAKRTDAEESR